LVRKSKNKKAYRSGFEIIVYERGKLKVKRKNFKIWSTIWAVVWAFFTFVAWYYNMGLGTIATLGGIALMFAWIYEQSNIKD